MSDKETGGSAFPVPGLNDDESFNGMDLRDYAAIHADVPWSAVAEGFYLKHKAEPTISDLAQYAAQIRYAMAGAMILERAK